MAQYTNGQITNMILCDPSNIDNPYGDSHALPVSISGSTSVTVSGDVNIATMPSVTVANPTTDVSISNDIKVMGIYQTATLSAGESAPLFQGEDGALVTRTRCSEQTLIDGVPNTNRELPLSCNGDYVNYPVFPYVYNGTTWDRLRGSAANGLTVSLNNDVAISSMPSVTISGDVNIGSMPEITVGAVTISGNVNIGTMPSVTIANPITDVSITNTVNVSDTNLPSGLTVSGSDLQVIDSVTRSYLKKIGRYADVQLGVNQQIIATTGGVPGNTWTELGNANYAINTRAGLTTIRAVSSNGNDTDGGSGCWAVRVYGLDGNWNEQYEDVSLNGTTAVNLSNQFTRVNWITGLMFGSGQKFAGNITVEDTAGNDWAFCRHDEDGYNNCSFSVPRGKIALLKGFHMSPHSTEDANIQFQTRNASNETAVPYTGRWQIVQQNTRNGERSNLNEFPYYITFDELSDVKVRGNLLASGTRYYSFNAAFELLDKE